MREGFITAAVFFSFGVLAGGVSTGLANQHHDDTIYYRLGDGFYIVKRRPHYTPGHCYAVRGLGPLQEVSCEEPDAWKANKDAGEF